jgi:hypothetical protein
MAKHHLQMVVSFLLVSALTGCGGGTGSLPGTSTTLNQFVPTGNAARLHAATSTKSSSSAAYLAIDAGSTASAGDWVADTDYTASGTTGVKSVASTINTSQVTSPPSQAVYQTQRYATHLTYTIPGLAANAGYTVRLHFVESFFSAAQKRVFGVKINGVQVLTNFDVFKTADGSNIAIAESFSTQADATGNITIQLDATVNNASIAGIELTEALTSPTPTPSATPVIAIDAGGSAASSGWVADTDYVASGWSGVATVANAIATSLIASPAPQAVYQSQRWAQKMTYTIPKLTVDGSYNVELDLVESYWTAAKERLFNVTINGVQVLTSFDIFATAGGDNVAIAKQFATTADSTGTITIVFTATTDTATIAGIRILPASTEAVAPAPTAEPTATPSATPIPVPSANAAWPAAGWVPYPKSPLTVAVAPSPTYTASSSAIISAMWSSQPSSPGNIQVYSGPAPPSSQDYSQPLYFGHSTDPVYTVSCFDYGGACPASGAKVHIPIGAYPAGGTDHHIAIRDLTTGMDVMLWLAPVPNGIGGAYSVGWGTIISSTGDGLNAVGGTASGISALWALRETDLAHDTVNHAIIILVNGESADGYVYPAVGWDNQYFHADPWPRMGAHLWLDVAPPYAAGCPQYAVSYLTALNKYGAYFADQGAIGTPILANFESDMEYTYNGGASVWGPLMETLGGTLVGESNVGITNCGIDMQTHMHILNPPAPI